MSYSLLSKTAGIKLITPQETAEILGVSVKTLDVWRCTKRYQLRFIKVGRRVMYRMEDIQAFIENRTSIHLK